MRPVLLNTVAPGWTLDRLVLGGAAATLLVLLVATFVTLSGRIADLEQILSAAPRDQGTGDRPGSSLGYVSDRTALSLRLSTALQHSPAIAAAATSPEAAAGTRAAASIEPVAAANTAPAAVELAPTKDQESPGFLSRIRSAVGPNSEGLEQARIRGLRDTLAAATEVAAARLGDSGGFSDDPNVRIELPAKLAAVRSILRNVGMSALMDDLELRMNEAAESSVDQARTVFLAAIEALPIEDAAGLANGADNAASRYFQSRMTARLSRELRPQLDQALEQNGSHALYEQAIGIYSALPFVPEVEGDITHFVSARAIQGFFQHIAAEEARIRGNPQLQTTDSMQVLFSKR